MNPKYSDMTADELKKALEQLFDQLEDTEMLRRSVLGQTGNHVSGGYSKRFDQELSELNEEIANIKEILKTKQQDE